MSMHLHPIIGENMSRRSARRAVPPIIRTTTSISTARATPTGFRAPAFRGWPRIVSVCDALRRVSPTVRTGSEAVDEALRS